MTKTDLVKILKVLADYTRMNILANVYTRPNISGKELLVMQKISQPTLSFHLGKLEMIDIIKVKKLVKLITITLITTWSMILTKRFILE